MGGAGRELTLAARYQWGAARHTGLMQELPAGLEGPGSPGTGRSGGAKGRQRYGARRGRKEEAGSGAAEVPVAPPRLRTPPGIPWPPRGVCDPSLAPAAPGRERDPASPR